MEEGKKPENPAAFPILDPNSSFWNAGMTLRDYFAAKAMQSILNHKLERGMTTEKGFAEALITEASYEVADAMLKQR